MKTNLPQAITSTQEAEKFLTELYHNGESYHPDDDAFDIEWDMPKDQAPTDDEKCKLNKLMGDIFDLPETKKNWPNPDFDPYGILLDLFYKDHPDLCDKENKN